MKKGSFIILFFCVLFTLKDVLSQEYYIKYGVNDCAKCNFYLHHLATELDGRGVKVLFPSRFKSDSGLVVSQLGLEKFNYTLVFDDSIYKHFVKGEESYFIATSEDTVFKTKLKELDLMGVKAILQADKLIKERPKEVCVIKKNSDDSYYLINNSTTISTSRNLNRVTYQDLNSNNVIEVIPDTSWTRMAYQKYYGEHKYKEKYNIYLELLNEAPPMKTTTTYTLCEANILYFYSEVKFWEYKDSLSDHVGIIPKMAIFTYDLSEKKLINCSIIPQLQNSGYHVSNIGKFIKSDDIFYFFIMERTPTDSSKVLARYKQKGSELVFDEILDFTLSNNYIKYKLGNNFRTPSINGHVFSFQLSDKIYDIRTGKTFQIPIDSAEYETIEGILEYAIKITKEGGEIDRTFYSLFDAVDKGNAYGVLYTDKNNDLIEVLFDKETGSVLKKQKIELDLGKMLVSYHPQNNNQLIYYNAKDPDGCFHIIDL